MKRAIVVLFIFLFCFDYILQGQTVDSYELLMKAIKYNSDGDFINAEKTFLRVIDPETNAPPRYLVAAYCDLGGVVLTLGNFDKALEYNLKSETYVTDPESLDMADIFCNRALIMHIKKSYDVALEYLEKSIRIYKNIDPATQGVKEKLNLAYNNISIVYIDTRQYRMALNYLEKSIDLSTRHKLKDLGLLYLNTAKTYNKLGNKEKATEYFLLSISQFKKDFGDGYYRLVDTYFEYGLFLQSELRFSDAYTIHRKALNICIKTYGKKHTLVSLAYKHLGDHYSLQNKYDSALYYYQKSLISVSKNFDDENILSNPSIDSSLFELRLLDDLKSKSVALEKFAQEQNNIGKKIQFLQKSLETIDFAIQMIDRIRNNYISEESRIYLAENEKETFLSGVRAASALYSLDHDKNTAIKMYGIAQKAKAAILRNEITGNELLYSKSIPDSLRNAKNTLSGEIDGYNKLILEESRKQQPNTLKISVWKDDLFKRNREKEQIAAKIEKAFPLFKELIGKTEPSALNVIQKHLKKDETIVDYLLSNKYNDGKRQLYIFLISRNKIDFLEEQLDSMFIRNSEIIRSSSDPSLATNNFTFYTDALNFMYLKLIKPVESLLTGTKLIIIPDEEIGWLPFDAFLKNKPNSEQKDYEGLTYLINKYTFSYGYSSSLIFNSPCKLFRTNVVAFSPDYSNTNGIASLKGTGIEINSIFKGFSGQNFAGNDATKENFQLATKNAAIFHLAMHSSSDSTNSRFSYLMFDTHNSSTEKGKLFNYEISLLRIKSPMVVLSACNSGIGTMYYGEGMMSLSRGFILAGASSVVTTAWDVNDDASAVIMASFYENLSEGKPKNVAMRNAKLEYLKNSSPAFKNPYFWAAYEVMGDNSPLAGYFRNILIYCIAALLIAGILILYFRRRSIFSDRSR